MKCDAGRKRLNAIVGPREKGGRTEEPNSGVEINAQVLLHLKKEISEIEVPEYLNHEDSGGLKNGQAKLH
jgi:hypothetical protein